MKIHRGIRANYTEHGQHAQDRQHEEGYMAIRRTEAATRKGDRILLELLENEKGEMAIYMRTKVRSDFGPLLTDRKLHLYQFRPYNAKEDYETIMVIIKPFIIKDELTAWHENGRKVLVDG